MLTIILLVLSFLIAAIWFLETKDDKSIAGSSLLNDSIRIFDSGEDLFVLYLANHFTFHTT